MGSLCPGMLGQVAHMPKPLHPQMLPKRPRVKLAPGMLTEDDNARWGSELGISSHPDSPARWMLICSRCHQEECVCELGRGAPAEEKPTLVDEKTPVKPITILSILQDAPRKKGVINVKPSSKLAQRGREVGQAIASQEPPVSLTSGLADVASSYHSDDTPELKGTDFNDVFSVDRRPFQSLAARPKRKARPPTPTPEDNPKKLRPRVCSCYIPVHGSVVCATCGFLRKEHRSEACDFFTPSESGLTCIVCDQPKRHHFGDA